MLPPLSFSAFDFCLEVFYFFFQGLVFRDLAFQEVDRDIGFLLNTFRRQEV